MAAHHSDRQNQKKYSRVTTQLSRNRPVSCESCNGEVRMILVEKAAAVCQCSRRRIYRWVEEGDLHYLEMQDGAVFVCGRSLAKKIEKLDSTTNKLATE